MSVLRTDELDVNIITNPEIHSIENKKKLSKIKGLRVHYSFKDNDDYFTEANFESFSSKLGSFLTWDEEIRVFQSGFVGFNINGTADENITVRDLDPWGNKAVVWECSNNDATSDADGGWNTTYFTVDPNIMYRYSIWIRRKVIGNGSYYFGCNGYNSSSQNIGVLNRSNGSVNTNPYFSSGNWVYDGIYRWYFFVAHVWPVGSGTGSVHSDSGIYDINGNKVGTTSDFVWNTGTAYASQRSYLYYSTDSSTLQQMVYPFVGETTQNIYTVREFLKLDNRRKIRDNSGNGFDITSSFIKSNGGIFFNYDGNNAIDLDSNIFNTIENEITIMYWTNKDNTLVNSIFECYNSNGGREINIHHIWSDSNIYWDCGADGITSGVDRINAYYRPSFGMNHNTHFIEDSGMNHFTFTKNALTGYMKIYVNGRLLHFGTGFTKKIKNINSVVLGGYNSKTIGYYGKISNFKIYNRELSQNEIIENINQDKSELQTMNINGPLLIKGNIVRI